MRDIKFRGKDIDEDRWIYGNLNIIKTDNRYLTAISGIDSETNDFTSFSFINVYHNTIGQFTGLKDKNGVEIYEGDIIRISEVLDRKNVITTVEYKKNAFRYIHIDGSGSVLPEHTKKIEGYESITVDIEVIGNIHENHELLEEK